ncbi:MAG: type II toxin-antitoxin system HicB family antitoxin [Deltaproteobacteria bacterium]|nr:type II toxin-antitoxin system HicB family antitoxin [Deltaproteobacteria bacterium]
MRHVILEHAEEGGYTVYCPSLRGCVSQGETREEALANIKEAIELYIESLNAHNEFVPPDIDVEIEAIAV